MFSNFNFMNGAHHHGGQMPQTMPQGRQDMRAHAAAMEEQRRRYVGLSLVEEVGDIGGGGRERPSLPRRFLNFKSNHC